MCRHRRRSRRGRDVALERAAARILARAPRGKRKGRPIVSSTPYLEYLAEWDDFTVSAYDAPGERCPAGHGYLYVDPLGRAYPCAYTKGKTVAVDLLAHDWRQAWDREKPCSACTVGPMLEFNMLFKRPLAAARESLRTYG